MPKVARNREVEMSATRTLEEFGGASQRPVSRISVSLPEKLLQDLDQMVGARGFSSRSQAIGEMLHQALTEHRSAQNDVMVGVITLYYDNATPNLQQELAALQCRHIDECISSLHVHLQSNHTMEVVLVQGPALDIRAIANKMTAMRGVVSGRVHLVSSVMPPLHPFEDG